MPPVNLEIINTDIVVDSSFLAQDTISFGGDFAMTPDVRILAPAKVEAQAGNMIVLRNGVLIEEGAELTLALGPVFVPTCGVPGL